MSLYEAFILLEDLVYCVAELEDVSDCLAAIQVIGRELGLR
jgi:hypothetical protein